MNGKQIDEFFILPDKFVTEYYKLHKDVIFDACKFQFEALKKHCIDNYNDIPNPNPKVVGRMLGLMFYADDWKTLAMALEIIKDQKERDVIWGKLHRFQYYLIEDIDDEDLND